MRSILTEISAYRRNNFRLFPQERQAVCDVARRAAKFHRKLIDAETQVDAMHLVGHETIGKETRIVHDSVVCDRTRNDDFRHTRIMARPYAASILYSRLFKPCNSRSM